LLFGLRFHETDTHAGFPVLSMPLFLERNSAGEGWRSNTEAAVQMRYLHMALTCSSVFAAVGAAEEKYTDAHVAMLGDCQQPWCGFPRTPLSFPTDSLRL